MRLYYQRIPLSRVVTYRLVESAFPLSTLLVLPFVDAGITQLDVPELRIGIPNDPRCLLICGKELRRFVEPLLHDNLKRVTLDSRFTFDMLSDLPTSVGRTSVLSVANGLVLMTR